MAAANQDLTLSGQVLEARFFVADDRHVHEISLKTARGNGVILQSIEGTSDEAWPPSPPLQNLTAQQGSTSQPLLPGRQVAMLLGMAGQSHWSLAAELVISPEGEWLIFDLACRAAAAPQFLGSRYRLGPDARWDAETDLISLPQRSARLRADASAAVVRPARSPGEIEIVPRLAATRLGISFPGTIRWKYSVEVLKPEAP